MTSLAKLHAIEEIKQLRARYLRAVNTKDEATLREVFTPDPEIDVRDAGGADKRDERLLFRDGRLFAAAIIAALNGTDGFRIAHNPEIEFLSNAEARGTWSQQDWMWPDPNGSSKRPYKAMRGWGYYHETYRKTGSGWRIQSMRVSRIRVEIDPL